MTEHEHPDPAHRPPPRSTHADAVRESRRVWLQVLAFAAVYVIWGSTYLAIRVAVRTLPPFLMAASRFLLAGSTLYAILRGRGVARPRRGEWRRAALAGLLMLAIGNGLVTWAELRVPSNVTALMITCVPLFTALLDWLRPGGARPDPRVLLGIGLGGAGMALLVANPGGHTATASSEATALGTVALLVAGLGWAGGSLYSRYGGMHRHPLMAAAQQMLAGGAAMLVIGLARGEAARLSAAALTARSVGAFFYLTIFGSLVAFSAFGWLIQVSTPARLSTTAYVNPVIAVLLGWLVLGETLAPRALAGASLIIGAVVVMAIRPARVPLETDPARSTS